MKIQNKTKTANTLFKTETDSYICLEWKETKIAHWLHHSQWQTNQQRTRCACTQRNHVYIDHILVTGKIKAIAYKKQSQKITELKDMTYKLDLQDPYRNHINKMNRYQTILEYWQRCLEQSQIGRTNPPVRYCGALQESNVDIYKNTIIKTLNIGEVIPQKN